MNETMRMGATLVARTVTAKVDEPEDAATCGGADEASALVGSARAGAPTMLAADEMHRLLVETLDQGALMIAPDTVILYANRKLGALLGLPLDAVIGAPLTRFLAPDDAEVFAALLLEIGRGSGRSEVALATTGGEPVPVMLSVSAVGGDHDTFTVAVTDLTGPRQAQRALEEANALLEARVLARTREVADANAALRVQAREQVRLSEELRHKAEELAEADQRKDELLSMLAHELRNPLSPILTAAEMMRLLPPSVPALERYRTVIERQTRNLARLVDDLLDVSRVTRRAITLRKQPVEVARLVRHAVDATRSLLQTREHSLTVRLPAERVRVCADPARFEQVIVNLLDNAAKYTERGGHIVLSAEPIGEHLVLRVRDDGAGIRPDLLPHVFELFVQGERSLARSQGGLGIGLTLVKNLVEMHGGTVEARSEGPGKGSELIVSVPIHRDVPALVATPAASPGAEPTEEPAAGAPPQKTSAANRILVVEDNEDAAAMLVDLLHMWGFEVRSADNGTDALRIASEFHPCAALIDVGLPDMDGYEVARQLRSSRPGRGDPRLIVGVTGYGQESDMRRGSAAGFDHHLVKPVDPDVLLHLLKRECDPALQ